MDYDVAVFYLLIFAIVFTLAREPLYFFIVVLLYYLLEKQDVFDTDVFLLLYFMFWLISFVSSNLKGLINNASSK